MLRFLLCFATVLAMSVSGASASVEDDAGYLRCPDLFDDYVVFTAEADLWMAPVGGGTAQRLTSHVGTEYFPQFSPDGALVAFTGDYDGNADVFVIPSIGGEPRRLTWHPGRDEVIGWTPDGKSILFRSRREGSNGDLEIYSISLAGGHPEKLPLGWASRISIDPDTGLWAFNRTQRERRTWKRYRGGTATQIWVGDPGAADFHRVSQFEGMNAFPMWNEGRIYFLSDQGGTVNIWSMTAEGGDRQRHTDLGDWDARFPAMGNDGRIVFMLAGDIHMFDPLQNTEIKLDIRLPSDRILTRNRYTEPGRYLSWFELSPDGERVVVTARGEMFSVPVEDGVTLPLTRGSGARESWGYYDHEGERLVYVTDASHEEEIRVMDAWGRGESTVVKSAGDSGYHFPPQFSPDGKWIAYSDQTQTLYVISASGGDSRVVDKSSMSEITDYAWSPDGRWLAYSKQGDNFYSNVYIYDVRESELHPVTGSTTHDYQPAWDPDGRFLYFLSDRTTNPLLGNRDFQNVNIEPTKPYLVLLDDDAKSPFANLAGLPPDEDDEDEKDKKDEKDEKDDDGDEKELPEVEIDLNGLSDRVIALPIEAGIYSSLGATSSKVFYAKHPMQGMADWGNLFGDAGPQATLMAFDLKKEKAKKFMGGISGYSLAPGADKIAVMKKRGDIYVVSASSPPGDDLGESKVSLDGIVLELDPRQEWEQVYYEAWRQMRDFYWDAGMGGVEWKQVRDQYAQLLPRLATRDDLRDLIGEVIGEMATSHTYVWGGDQGKRVPRVSVGLLGADLVREGDAYRVARIFHGDPADDVRSPLLEPGVGVREGDYILAVNGMDLPEDRPFYASLEGFAGKDVLLTVNDRPSKKDARDVVVVPVGNEGQLRYVDWVRQNREYVAAKTDGKMAYIHVPNMMGEGMMAFNTWFYPQLDREGMVVDMRWNGGGFVSQMILERFRRHVISFGLSRGGAVDTYPYRTLNGPFVVLTNEFAGSDGDIFPAAVQLEGLAPVIGVRSWGGVVGIRADKRMVDGGLLTEPEFAWWDSRSGWELENHGVDPDIEVVNLPQDLARGVDAQLDRAIDEVLRLHQENPPLVPEFGPVRPRGREDYRGEMTEVTDGSVEGGSSTTSEGKAASKR